MKKIWAFILAVCVCAGMTACSSGESASSSQAIASAGSAESPKTEPAPASAEPDSPAGSTAPEVSIDGLRLELPEFGLALTFPEGWTLAKETEDGVSPAKQSAVNEDKSQQVFIQELPRNGIDSMDSFIDAYSKEVQNESRISNFNDKGPEILAEKEFRRLELQSQINDNTLYQVTYFYMNETTILQVVETAQKPEDLETIKQVLSAAQ